MTNANFPPTGAFMALPTLFGAQLITTLSVSIWCHDLSKSNRDRRRIVTG
jgi:hypothetical protein